MPHPGDSCTGSEDHLVHLVCQLAEQTELGESEVPELGPDELVFSVVEVGGLV